MSDTDNKEKSAEQLNREARHQSDVENGRTFGQNPFKWISDKLGTDEAERAGRPTAEEREFSRDARHQSDVENGRTFGQNPLKWASDKLGTDEAERAAPRIEKAQAVNKDSGAKDDGPARDPNVAQAQLYLRALGYNENNENGLPDTGRIDGITGAKTEAALQKFTGSDGPLTQETLEQLKTAVESDPAAFTAAKNMTAEDINPAIAQTVAGLQGDLIGQPKAVPASEIEASNPALSRNAPAAGRNGSVSAETQQALKDAGTASDAAPETPAAPAESAPEQSELGRTVSGAIDGATLGSVSGPIGTLVGGAIGAFASSESAQGLAGRAMDTIEKYGARASLSDGDIPRSETMAQGTQLFNAGGYDETTGAPLGEYEALSPKSELGEVDLHEDPAMNSQMTPGGFAPG